MNNELRNDILEHTNKYIRFDSPYHLAEMVVLAEKLLGKKFLKEYKQDYHANRKIRR